MTQEPIRVTPQEAAILQSYPPAFQWRGSRTKQYLQIGNAVPPLLAQPIFEALWAEPVATEAEIIALHSPLADDCGAAA